MSWHVEYRSVEATAAAIAVGTGIGAIVGAIPPCYPWSYLAVVIGLGVFSAVAPGLWASRHATRVDVDSALRFE